MKCPFCPTSIEETLAMSGRSEKEAHVHVLNAILDYAVKVEDFSLRDSILGQMSDMGRRS